MAYTVAQCYAIAAAAQRVESAAFARSLTNNPSAQLESDLEAAVVAFDVAAGTALLPTQTIITSGSEITAPVTGTGTTGVTPTIVAGAVTALVLS